MTTNDKIPGISPQQTAFLILPAREALYGGSAGGGKSEALLLGALQYVDDSPVSSLLLRRTYRDLDKPGGLMFRAREWLQGTDAHWDGINYRWSFPSGATLNFGYLEHEGDEIKYQSSEYQYVGFDELTHFPEHQYLYLFSRLRRLKGSSVPLRLRGGTNPGGPGHEWVRKRWSLPNGPPANIDRAFVQASMFDNPFLDHDDYEKGLDELGEVTKAQLKSGDWTATSTGGYFHAENFKLIGWDQVPDATEFAAIVRYWDFAATEPSDMNPDPDYTVGVKLGMTMTGSMDPELPDWYVIDVERFRGNPGFVEARVAATGLQDGSRVVQWLEEERGAAGKLLFRHYAMNVLSQSTCRPLRAELKKEVKAKPVAARVDEGRIFLIDGPWVDDFMAECAVFPLGSHDDQVDSFSSAMIAIDRERVFAGQGAVERVGKHIRALRRQGSRMKPKAHIGY